ncbi:MAG: helix-turn-helix domain-containing protein [Fimbriimonas sp.]
MEQVSGSSAKAVGLLNVPSAHALVVVSHEGSLLVRDTRASKPVSVIPPQSVSVIPEGRYQVTAGRGSHQLTGFQLDLNLNQSIGSWLNSLPSRVFERSAACRSLIGPALHTVQRLGVMEAMGASIALPNLLSVVYEFLAYVAESPNEIVLGTLPNDLPESIVELTNRVAENPADSWPLKQAAEQASYSPFHFSRVFKQVVGYGFHEYVDRRRVEMAVRKLLGSDDSSEVIAKECGYGTVQAFRESIKEYLGLLPTEIRPGSSGSGPREP